MSDDNCSLNNESENEYSDSSSDESIENNNVINYNENQMLSLEDDEDLLVLPPEDADDEINGEDDCDSKSKFNEESISQERNSGNKNDHSLSSFKLQDNASSFLTNEPSGDNKKKKRRKKLYTICLSNCKYESLRRVTKRFGFREVNEEDDWNLIWTDFSVNMERVNGMKKYQKINHYPGMLEICRKDSLARNMNRMCKLFGKEYNIAPKSWCLPADYADLQAYARQKKHKTYILKPDAGCQGRGIWITKNPKEIKPSENMVCQVYLSKPFLIDGFKFDLRIYVLVTSCDPLRVFAYKDGLVRFTTTKYSEPNFNNVDNIYMHLTNYSLQKHSDNFVHDDEEGGTKRRITTLNRWFVEKGYNIEKIWNDVDDIIIKTLISAHTLLKHNYRTCFPNHVRGSACFEILGFDVIFDKKLKPFLVEVNHSPSFHTDSKLDKEIKEALLWDTLQLVNFAAADKKRIIDEEKRKIRERLFQKQNRKDIKDEVDKEMAKFMEIQEKYEDSHLGNFRRIYPGSGSSKYDKFFSTNVSLYQETAAFKARSECARQQREEIKQKQEKFDSILKRKDRKDVRPESPEERPKRKVLNSVSNKTSKQTGIMRPRGYLDKSEKLLFDMSKPQEINDDEEIERLSGLLQRDNLIRALGIVEIVYKALHNTGGTMAYQHTSNTTQAIIPQLNSQSQYNKGNLNNTDSLSQWDSVNSKLNMNIERSRQPVLQNNYTTLKSRNIKSSHNKINNNLQNKDASDSMIQGTLEKAKNINSLNNLIQRFTPPLNIQNPRMMNRIPSNPPANQGNGYFSYSGLSNFSSNSNGLFNILKFQSNHHPSHIQSINQNFSDNLGVHMELQGLSVLTTNNSISKKNDHNPISIQQLPFNQLAASGRNYSKKPQNASKTSYQSNNNSLIKFANDENVVRTNLSQYKKQLSASDLKLKDVTLPTVS